MFTVCNLNINILIEKGDSKTQGPWWRLFGRSGIAELKKKFSICPGWVGENLLTAFDQLRGKIPTVPEIASECTCLRKLSAIWRVLLWLLRTILHLYFQRQKPLKMGLSRKRLSNKAGNRACISIYKQGKWSLLKSRMPCQDAVLWHTPPQHWGNTQTGFLNASIVLWLKLTTLTCFKRAHLKQLPRCHCRPQKSN